MTVSKKPAAKKPLSKAMKARKAFQKTVAETTAANKTKVSQVGNRFWEARTTHGRDKIFSDPEILWDACKQYFKWVEENPLFEAKAFAYEGDVSIESIPKLRAMTVGSLSLFLGINTGTWYDYAKRDGFSDVCMSAEQVIREQKFGGASAGLLNAAIIARDLGLADKRELSGPDGQPLKSEATLKLDPAQIRDIAKSVLDEF